MCLLGGFRSAQHEGLNKGLELAPPPCPVLQAHFPWTPFLIPAVPTDPAPPAHPGPGPRAGGQLHPCWIWASAPHPHLPGQSPHVLPDGCEEGRKGRLGPLALCHVTKIQPGFLKNGDRNAAASDPQTGLPRGQGPGPWRHHHHSEPTTLRTGPKASTQPPTPICPAPESSAIKKNRLKKKKKHLSRSPAHPHIPVPRTRRL